MAGAACLACWLSLSGGALAEGFTESEVKAALLVKVTQFVDWPASAFSDSTGPLRIAILEPDPFGAKFDESLRGVTVAGRSIRLTRCRTVAEAEGCHVLFVGSAAEGVLAPLLRQLEGKPVLTAGDGAGLAREGVMINFYKDEGKVRLELNVAAARKAGLRISAKLVQVSRVVGP